MSDDEKEPKSLKQYYAHRKVMAEVIKAPRRGSPTLLKSNHVARAPTPPLGMPIREKEGGGGLKRSSSFLSGESAGGGGLKRSPSYLGSSGGGGGGLKRSSSFLGGETAGGGGLKRSPSYLGSSGGLKRSPSYLTNSKSTFSLSDFAADAGAMSEPESSPVDMLQDSDRSRSSSQSTAPTSIGGFEHRRRESDEENFFPSYGNQDFQFKSTFIDMPSLLSPETSDDEDESKDTDARSQTSDSATAPSPDLPPIIDDTALRPEPNKHVDYLSHNWNEEEVAIAWRGIVCNRKTYGERSRLENASWRGWTKHRLHLPTVDAKSINWKKDSDTTWLYGPIQDLQKRAFAESMMATRPTDKKPILKKRTASEVMLLKSLSSASLVAQAASVANAERNFSRPYLRKRMNRPFLGRAQSDFGHRGPPLEIPAKLSPMPSVPASGTVSPSAPAKRHIHFNESVQQAIVLLPDGPEEETPAWQLMYDSDSSEEELLMAPRKSTKKRPVSKRSSSKSSTASLESIKCIAPLPPAEIVFHCDRKRCAGDHEKWRMPSSISHSRHPFGIKNSMSTETLRPAHPSQNFLLTDQEAKPEPAWKDPTASSATFHLRADDRAMQGYGPGQARELLDQDEDTTAAEFFEDVTPTTTPEPMAFSTGGAGGLKRTQSGLMMPFVVDREDDDEDIDGDEVRGPRVRRGSWLGQVVESATETMNTVSDIAQVIWNVGWNTR